MLLLWSIDPAQVDVVSTNTCPIRASRWDSQKWSFGAVIEDIETR
jgi:hypothetical protein